MDDAADLATTLFAMGARARAAQSDLAAAAPAARTAALTAMADALADAAGAVLSANALDMAAAAEGGRPEAFLDRLQLTPARLDGVIAGLRAVADLPDPVGRVLAAWVRPNGLMIERISTPLGVIGLIFESRPNVAADAAALALRAGNAILLRGGADSVRSVAAIVAALRRGLEAAGLPAEAVQAVTSSDRDAVGLMLAGLDGALDVIIPRGGKSLVARVQAEARAPVLAHLEGICHTYVHESADPDKAEALVVNAKMRRVGVCGATETMLIDRAAAPALLPRLANALRAAGCSLRGDATARALAAPMEEAQPQDFGQEFLAPILAVAVVDGLDQAIAHIKRYGSSHTECIVAEDGEVQAAFAARVDSAIVMINASTQFADGGEFGFGGEVGIATGRLHARGPVGAEQLTSFKYVVRGQGQIRP